MDVLALQPLTLCLSKVALAAGTTSTLSTTGTTVYAINSKAYSKSALTNQATPTVDFATNLAFNPIAANQGSIFLVGLDASGALRATQGSVVALDVSGNFMYQAPTMPPFVDGFCPIGYIVVKAGSTASGTWVFGTNNMSGVTGLTYTFQDCIGWPSRPQVA